MRALQGHGLPSGARNSRKGRSNMRIRRPRATRHDLASESRHVRPAALVAVAVILTVALAYAASGVASTNDAQRVSKFTATPVELDGVPIEAAKSRTGRIAETDPDLLGRTDSAPVNVVVKLDYDSVATYQGTIHGLRGDEPEDDRQEVQAEPEEPCSAYEAHVAGGRRGNRLATSRAAVSDETVRSSYRGRLRRSRHAAAGQSVDELACRGRRASPFRRTSSSSP